MLCYFIFLYLLFIIFIISFLKTEAEKQFIAKAVEKNIMFVSMTKAHVLKVAVSHISAMKHWANFAGNRKNVARRCRQG